MIKVLKYTTEYEVVWDTFVNSSKNRHFFFQRNYMEYHSDRFKDFSLMFYDDKKRLLALLPANLNDGNLYSHQGLTFGGFIVDDKMKTETMLTIFDSLKYFLNEEGIKKVIYKCIPHIYHVKPSEEDKYALFRNNAVLVRRDVSSTIDLTEQVRYSKGRKWSINKAKKEKIEVVKSKDYDAFWGLLTNVLETRHEAKPVHSLEEIKSLAKYFPENIKLYLATKDGEVISGAVIYENNNVVHTQYLVNSAAGRDVEALDFLLDYLIKDKYKDKKYFDFGISNEDSGRFLNTGLIAQKEGFGARALVHDFYEINIE